MINTLTEFQAIFEAFEKQTEAALTKVTIRFVLFKNNAHEYSSRENPWLYFQHEVLEWKKFPSTPDKHIERTKLYLSFTCSFNVLSHRWNNGRVQGDATAAAALYNEHAVVVDCTESKHFYGRTGSSFSPLPAR